MKCVIYARVSYKEQEDEGFSVPAQRKLLREYATKNDFEIKQEFTDIESAKTAGRSNFGEMVEFLRTNKDVRAILVEKTDRLYRNFKDYVLLEDLDLEIHLVKENEIISKDSRSHAKFVHGIKVLLAKNYIDNLSEEVKKGMREKAEQGEYPGKAPFGYSNDKVSKLVIPDPKYTSMIVRLFEQYATGQHSLKSLMVLIFHEGWRTPRGRKVAKSMIEMILKNPFYIGDFLWRGSRYEGKHQPLISRQLFDQVQALLRSGASPRSGRRDFAFRGLLKCKHCGCAIVGEIHKGRYVYYHCTQAKGKCDQPWIREEVIDSQMASVLKAIEVDQAAIDDVIRALKDSCRDERVFRESEVKRLSARQTELQTRLDKAYEDRLDGVIDDRYWRDVSAKWRTEQDSVTAQLERLTGTGRDYVDQALKVLELSKMAYSLYVERNGAERRQLLKSVLSNCLFDGVTLYPTYKKPFDLIAEGVQNQFKLPRLDLNQRPAD
jgi:site-specific DNA recombinase